MLIRTRRSAHAPPGTLGALVLQSENCDEAEALARLADLVARYGPGLLADMVVEWPAGAAAGAADLGGVPGAMVPAGAA